jgi:rhamnose utilization protein RhaD (predicted bifunctional aldolase and dehydrogenase)
MPEIRGLISGDQKKVGHFDDSPGVLEFVNSNRLKELAALGTSCPDHFLRTKIRPLVIHPDGLDAAPLVADYRAGYAAYYKRCRHPDSPPMRDPNPVVFLVPGTGMITFARDKATARIAGEFYRNAISVMRGAATVDAYVGLPEQEAFDIEYWLLEGQAPAHAETEEPCRPHCARHRGPAASARRSRDAISPRAPRSCSPTSTAPL